MSNQAFAKQLVGFWQDLYWLSAGSQRGPSELRSQASRYLALTCAQDDAIICNSLMAKGNSPVVQTQKPFTF